MKRHTVIVTMLLSDIAARLHDIESSRWGRKRKVRELRDRIHELVEEMAEADTGAVDKVVELMSTLVPGLTSLIPILMREGHEPAPPRRPLPDMTGPFMAPELRFPDGSELSGGPFSPLDRVPGVSRGLVRPTVPSPTMDELNERLQSLRRHDCPSPTVPTRPGDPVTGEWTDTERSDDPLAQAGREAGKP